jgi:hypothetical protein
MEIRQPRAFARFKYAACPWPEQVVSKAKLVPVPVNYSCE